MASEPVKKKMIIFNTGHYLSSDLNQIWTKRLDRLKVLYLYWTCPLQTVELSLIIIDFWIHYVCTLFLSR